MRLLCDEIQQHNVNQRGISLSYDEGQCQERYICLVPVYGLPG